MKHTLLLFLLIISPILSHAKEVPTEGNWPNRELRLSVPACPIVYWENDVLSIYLEDVLTDLTIIITDSNGNIVYNDCISSCEPDYTHCIILGDKSDDTYTILLSHQHGQLTGVF